jgi:hypothetical protein
MIKNVIAVIVVVMFPLNSLNSLNLVELGVDITLKPVIVVA